MEVGCSGLKDGVVVLGFSVGCGVIEGGDVVGCTGAGGGGGASIPKLGVGADGLVGFFSSAI